MAEQAASTNQTAWWHTFGDAELNALIARMHAGNTTIQQAAARLAGAQARARLGSASRMPQVGLDTSASHSSGPLINDAGGNGSLYTAHVTASWEADLLGRLSGERKADRLDAQASEALLRDATLLMEAETARAYFRTLYLQQAQEAAAHSADLWREREAIATARLSNGLSQQVDLGQLQQRSLASAAEATSLSRQLAEARDELAFLIGETAPITLTARDLPQAPIVPEGLPSEVLARRPDVDAAAARMEAADQRLKSARRSWLPAFTLTASGGAASPSLGQLLSASARDFGAGLLFSLPIFDGGRHKAHVAGSKAELDLAKAQYRGAMLSALREVNDALAAVQSTDQQLHLAEASLAISKAEQTVITRRTANGTASRALLVESQLAGAEQYQAMLRAKYQRLASALELIGALGGWSG